MQKKKWAVFTDLESLRDSASGEFSSVRQTLGRLKNAGVPIIPISARTFEEVEPIARELGLTHPLIVEAGAATARFQDDRWELETCGPDADTILEVVREIEGMTGAHLSLYSVMRREDAARLSGLHLDSVPKSQRRKCDEPFLISHGSLDEVVAAAASLGYVVRHDGQFFHLCSAEGSCSAFTRIREELGNPTTVGIGSSAIDGDYLSLCEVAVIVPRAGRGADLELLDRIPHARIAPAPAADGWVAAVEAIRLEMVVPVKRIHAPLDAERAVS